MGDRNVLPITALLGMGPPMACRVCPDGGIVHFWEPGTSGPCLCGRIDPKPVLRLPDREPPRP